MSERKEHCPEDYCSGKLKLYYVSGSPAALVCDKCGMEV